MDGVDSAFEFAPHNFHYTNPHAAAAAAAGTDTSAPSRVAATSLRSGSGSGGDRKIVISLNPDRKTDLSAAALPLPLPALPPLPPIPTGRNPAYDLNSVRELRLWEFAEFEASDTNEMGQCIVSVPKSVRKQRKHQHKAMEDEIDITSTDDLLAPLVLHVLYRVKLPPPLPPASAASASNATAAFAAAIQSAGVHFVSPDKVLFPNRPAQCYVYTNRGDASLWFPCVENGGAGLDRCTFELEITVPAAFTVVATGTYHIIRSSHVKIR